MKSYGYKVVFTTNLLEKVTAGSVKQAIILATAEQIKGAFKTDIKYVECLDTGEKWTDVSIIVNCQN